MTKKIRWLQSDQYDIASAHRSGESILDELKSNQDLEYLIIKPDELLHKNEYFVVDRIEAFELLNEDDEDELLNASVERILARFPSVPAVSTSSQLLKAIRATGEAAGQFDKHVVRVNAGGDIIGLGAVAVDPARTVPVVDVGQPASALKKALLTASLGLEKTSDDIGPVVDLGRTRAGQQDESTNATEESGPPPDHSPIILSAEVSKRELVVGNNEYIKIQIAFPEDFDQSQEGIEAANANPDEDIWVIFSEKEGKVAFPMGSAHQYEYPKIGEPRTASFPITPNAEGPTTITVEFNQSGSVIGGFYFAIEIFTENDHDDTDVVSFPQSGNVYARSTREEDKNVLALQVDLDGQTAGANFLFKFICPSLDWDFKEARSNAFIGAPHSFQDVVSRYIQRIYRTVSELTYEHHNFHGKLSSIGTELCKKFLNPKAAELLWENRKKITCIHLIAHEHTIPWELVKLYNPQNESEIDDKFLCEYGLIRKLPGRLAASRFRGVRDLSHLTAKYPAGSFERLTSVFEAHKSREWLKEYRLRAIEPNEPAFFDALDKSDFDILHITCHGFADADAIDKSALVIGDVFKGGKPKSVQISPRDVRSEFRKNEAFETRRPIVFLNACETGSMGRLITSWDGWTKEFLEAGAGAFISPTWPVRDLPAQEFAGAFYEALAKGQTLKDCADAARKAANLSTQSVANRSDASWLAYRVYGDPFARYETP